VLNELLQGLGNEAQALAAADFGGLSDLDAAELGRFRETWSQIGPDRRLAVLKKLGELAIDKIELNFDAINRLALEDPDPRARAQAIDNLWESEEPQLARTFVQALREDPADQVRAAAGLALGSFVLLAETQGLDPELQRQIEQALLESVRQDPMEAVRLAGLQSLGYSTLEEVPGLIEAAFSTGSPRAQLAALRAMARSADPRWGSQVMATLHSADRELRLEAVRAAGELGLRQAVEELVDLLEDVDDRVRAAAIWSLSQAGGAAAARALTRLRNRATGEEGQRIQDALDNLAFEDGAQDLFDLGLEDEDPAA
jgi:HEAT repeat protein